MNTSADKPVSLELIPIEGSEGNIALINIDNPPVNALSHAVRQGLFDAVESAQANPYVSALLICCEGRTFVAGADVREFGQPPKEPHLPDLVIKIDGCQKPVVAALFGTVLGGGFELAMACHYRVAIQGAKVGLPEVNLGLIPGAGGTQLLPRLVGIEKALEMATSGKPVNVADLAETDVVDLLVEENLFDHALEFTRQLVLDGAVATRQTTRMQIPPCEDAEALLDNWRTALAKKARGQIAPQHIVDSISNALTLDYDDGQKLEREKFVECRDSSQSRAMRHAFFAERAVARIPNLDKDTEIQPVEKVAVIGAGTMGGGIAMCFASRGIPVRLLEVNPDNLQRGLGAIQANYQKTMERGLMSEGQVREALGRIEGTTDYELLADVDLVVEAAFENMEVKREIFSTLDRMCKSEAVLASNTSYLDINRIAESTNRPNQVLGMHFFSPANVMKLLEVVRAEQTDDQTLASAMALGKKIGKISVAVGHCYGFVGNRMYACYGREAQVLLLEGCTPAQIDQAMTGWGMAMGPLAVNDMSGIDIAYKARHENSERFADDPLYFKPADLMVEAGRLGRKTGAGFYRYRDGKQQEDPEVTELIRAEAERLGVRQRQDISAEEISNRLVLALINEGANILDQGLAYRASDIDTIWLNGYGFPRFRGGPMCYADEIGLEQVLAMMEAFEQTTGSGYWAASPLLRKLCADHKLLAEFGVQ